MKHYNAKNHTAVLASFLVSLLVLTIVVSITLVSLTYHYLVLDGQWSLSSEWLRKADVGARSATLGQLGDYFGGTLNPILSFSGFVVLLLTVVLQRRQLQEGTRQLEQSTRAIDLEAFVRVNDILQTAEGIAARERLYELVEEGQTTTSFAQWAGSDKKAVETVCRQFELVGLLVEGRLFDPDLFLRSWQRTITRCWLACQDVVAELRLQQQDPGLWQHFEALDAMAKAHQGAQAPWRHDAIAQR